MTKATSSPFQWKVQKTSVPSSPMKTQYIMVALSFSLEFLALALAASGEKKAKCLFLFFFFFSFLCTLGSSLISLQSSAKQGKGKSFGKSTKSLLGALGLGYSS